MRIGILASELSKVLCGRPLKEIEGSTLKDYTFKSIEIMKRWGLSCAEFSIKFDQLEEITKVIAKEDDMDFLLHETGDYSAARLSYVNKEDRKRILEGLRETIDYASEGGFTVLTVHPALFNPKKQGYAYSDRAKNYLSSDEAWDVSTRLLRELTRYAEKKGIVLGLENMPFNIYEDGEVLEAPHLGRTKNEFMRILSSINMDGLKMTFDVGHANTICQPADYINGIVDVITHIHIHDNDGRYDQHASLGAGTVNFDLLFKVLRNEDYNGTITIERIVDENIISDLEKVRYYISKNPERFLKNLSNGQMT